LIQFSLPPLPCGSHLKLCAAHKTQGCYDN
jgi:hypothetical protein